MLQVVVHSVLCTRNETNTRNNSNRSRVLHGILFTINTRTIMNTLIESIILPCLLIAVGIVMNLAWVAVPVMVVMWLIKTAS